MARLGIDVGGTHTDAVLVTDRLALIAKAKVATTVPVGLGIARAIEAVLEQGNGEHDDVQLAMLGTTQCVNSIVERRGLARVGILRIGAPTACAVPPLCDWPDDLRRCVAARVVQVPGGCEFDGRVLRCLEDQDVVDACRSLRDAVDCIAVTSVFAPIRSDHELRAAEIIREELGDVPISLSHEIGSIGLLERENATVINAALYHVARGLVDGFNAALVRAGIRSAGQFFGQNDGTLMSADLASRYPVLTVACGPTHSIRGASLLADIDDAVVVDVGGTTTDIGVLAGGYARQSSVAVEIGGIRTNFPMPDILSVGLGGGTVIRATGMDVQLGPRSVGSRLSDTALAFGGTVVTATDVACALGFCNVGTCRPCLDSAFAHRAHEAMQALLEDSIDRMKTTRADVPVVLVGGGSVMFGDALRGASCVIRPPHAEVANAFGVAMGEVGGVADNIYDLRKMDRKDALADAAEKAKTRAVAAGACPESVSVVRVDDLALAYMPGHVLRVRVKAAGSLAQGNCI